MIGIPILKTETLFTDEARKEIAQILGLEIMGREFMSGKGQIPDVQALCLLVGSVRHTSGVTIGPEEVSFLETDVATLLGCSPCQIFSKVEETLRRLGKEIKEGIDQQRFEQAALARDRFRSVYRHFRAAGFNLSAQGRYLL